MPDYAKFCRERISMLHLCSGFVLMFICLSCFAEPYLAMETGNKCLSCHTNLTGGGKRTTFGTAFAQLTWPARTAPEEYWDGRIIDQLYIGIITVGLQLNLFR